jgi:hypothetical protein
LWSSGSHRQPFYSANHLGPFSTVIKMRRK